MFNNNNNNESQQSMSLPQPPPQPQPHHQHHHHHQQQQQQFQPQQFQQQQFQQQFQQPQLPPPPPQMLRQTSASSTNMPVPGQPEFHQFGSAPPPQPPQHHHHHQPPYDVHGDNFAAKRMRKIGQRKAVDYTSTVVRYTQTRMGQRDSRDRTVLQPTPAAAVDMLPAVAYPDNPSTSFAAKLVHTSLNKNRCSINRVLWTPTGRRLITGSHSGEFTLWNGQSFNFEMILQAHDQAIRSMVWSYNDNWMVTGDDGGTLKYWQNNMNHVKANKSAHKESVRGLSFCRTDLKFCSCSDDTTVKVWDFARCQEERSLTGNVTLLSTGRVKMNQFPDNGSIWTLDRERHGWDVKSVDWHPTKSLLVSGGKDYLVKLWDAKSGKELSSFHGHKNIVSCVKWNQNGNWVLTASKDQSIKVYDIRAMKELESFRGHQKDVTALAWHPFHEEYFVSGSFDGSIFHWLVGHDTPQVEIVNAHDNSVWDLAWHPIGYILCSGSNDHTTKFWSRNRPGDTARDKFNVGQSQGYGDHNAALAGRMPGNFPGPETPLTPGPFPPGLTRNEGTIPGIGVAMSLSIDSSAQSGSESRQSGPPPLPPGPHPSIANQQQAAYQQNPPQQMQLHQQQMNSLPMPPQNLPHLQPPSHLPHLQHPHLPRPPPQLQPLGMPPNMPSSMPMQMPGQMQGMQSGMNQMVPQMQPGHFMGMNPMHPGSAPPQAGGIPNGMQNMQSPSGNQMYPPGGAFNRPQGGPMPPMPGLNLFQPGNTNASGMGTIPSNFLQSGMPPPPLPPGPPPPQGKTMQ